MLRRAPWLVVEFRDPELLEPLKRKVKESKT
jgi:hypothetical protein